MVNSVSYGIDLKVSSSGAIAFVYMTYIRATPKQLWSALIWSALTNDSACMKS